MTLNEFVWVESIRCLGVRGTGEPVCFGKKKHLFTCTIYDLKLVSPLRKSLQDPTIVYISKYCISAYGFSLALKLHTSVLDFYSICVIFSELQKDFYLLWKYSSQASFC